MLLYACIILALFVILVVSITDCRNNGELQKRQAIRFSTSIYILLFIGVLFSFWFLTAFRGDSIGNDTVHYLNYYRWIADRGVNPDIQIEMGYQYFCLALSKISSDPFSLLLICATICYVVCGICICKYSQNILFSAILLFCIVFSFFASGLRQSIAMVLLLIAYEKIKQKKTILPILLIVFASLFHISALIGFLWFLHRYIPKKPIAVFLIAGIVAALAATGELNALLSTLLKEYESYFDSENAGTGWLGISYYALRSSAFYIFMYLAYKDAKKENSLVVSNSILALFTVCLGFSVNLFNRASLYFLLPIAIDMSNVFNSGKIRHRDMWMLLMGIVMLAYFLVTLVFRPEWNNLYPYEFNWN